MTNQGGFTLVESMIAMVLGLVLTLCIWKLFTIQTRTIDFTNALNDVQTKIMFTHNLLAKDIRQSGYFGGWNRMDVVHQYQPLSVFPGGCNTSWLFNLDKKIQGFEGATSPNNIRQLPDNCLPKDYVSDSDLLLVKYADPKLLITDSELDNKRFASHYFLRSEVLQGAILFDGYNAADAIESLPGGELVYNRKVFASLYFLAACELPECGESGAVLSQLVLQGNRFIRRALVMGVDQMQLEYGIDDDLDMLVDRYDSANNINDWNRVQSVRIYLLFRLNGADREHRDGKHILGSLQGNRYEYEPAGGLKNYRRKKIMFEVALRNN